jgi:hypothetical protein
VNGSSGPGASIVTSPYRRAGIVGPGVTFLRVDSGTSLTLRGIADRSTFQHSQSGIAYFGCSFSYFCIKFCINMM